MLDNQTVITGVSREVASLAAKAMGMVLDPSGGDAFSVGGFIFVFKNTADSGTIGHEGIHGIQSVVAGGTRQFLEHYNKASIIAGITREQVRKDTSGNDIVKQVGDRRINVAKHILVINMKGLHILLVLKIQLLNNIYLMAENK